METIPTPRTNKAFKSFADDALYEESARLERELHIAKQALEEISFGVCAKNKAGGCAQIELGKLQMQEIADMALTTINTLSA